MMCGLPCSGKTKRAREIYQYMQENYTERKVYLISDDDLLEDKNASYANSLSEKQTRGKIKAATERVLTKDSIVICDSMNYIKGFRYELYCIARAQRATHCVVYCNVDYETVSLWNRREKAWNDEAWLKEMANRMEVPNEKARWDSPLFSLKPEDATPLQVMDKALFNPVHKPKPNLSTLPLQLSDTTLLYELDKITNAILSELIAQKSILMPGEYLSVMPELTNEKLRIPPSFVTMPELRKLRSQYVRVAQMHPPSTKSEIAKQFVLFLNLHMAQ
jgi:protein KTI12